jgi:hypothetical protein
MMAPTGSADEPDEDWSTTLIPTPCINVWENAKLERQNANTEKNNFFIIGIIGVKEENGLQLKFIAE